jgi:hypothetical protein
MRPRGEMRIVRVSPKDGWTNFRASDQLLPLAAAREHDVQIYPPTARTHSWNWWTRALDLEKSSTKEVA